MSGQTGQKARFPLNAIIIRMEFIAEQERRLFFEAHGEKHAALLEKYKNKV